MLACIVVDCRRTFHVNPIMFKGMFVGEMECVCGAWVYVHTYKKVVFSPNVVGRLNFIWQTINTRNVMYYAGNQHNRMTEMISHLPDFRWSKHNRGRLILVWRWTYLGGWFDLVSPGDAATYRFSQISKKYKKKLAAIQWSRFKFKRQQTFDRTHSDLWKYIFNTDHMLKFISIFYNFFLNCRCPTHRGGSLGSV